MCGVMGLTAGQGRPSDLLLRACSGGEAAAPIPYRKHALISSTVQDLQGAFLLIGGLTGLYHMHIKSRVLV